jgi:hypothetical protein
MSTKEIKDCEGICKDIVDKKLPVFASESSLAAAKDIQGLRAIFDEVCRFCSLLFETFSVVNYSYRLIQCYYRRKHLEKTFKLTPFFSQT